MRALPFQGDTRYAFSCTWLVTRPYHKGVFNHRSPLPHVQLHAIQWKTFCVRLWCIKYNVKRFHSDVTYEINPTSLGMNVVVAFQQRGFSLIRSTVLF